MFNFTNENTKCRLKPYIDTRLAQIKKTKNTKCCKKKMNTGTLFHGGNENEDTHTGRSLDCTSNINMEILCLWAYSTEINEYAPQKKYPRIFKAALFIITICRKQIQYVSIIE